MAGTRLTLTLIYAIEIISLLFFAYYHSIHHHQQQLDQPLTHHKNKWSRIHQPFKTDRSGVSYLNTIVKSLRGEIHIRPPESSDRSADDTSQRNDDDEEEEDKDDIYALLNRIETNFQQVLFHQNTVQFHLIHHRNNERGFHINGNHQSLKQALQHGLDDIQKSRSNEYQTLYSRVISSEVHHSLHCDEINFDTAAKESETKKIHGTFLYDVHLIINCDNNLGQDDQLSEGEKIQIEVNEYGTAIIRIPETLSSDYEIVNNFLAKEVSSFLTKHFLQYRIMTPKIQHLLSTSSLKVSMTLIDSDPISYADNINSEADLVGPIEHYQLMSKIFQEQMDQSIVKLIEALSFSNVDDANTGTGKEDHPSTGLFQSSKVMFHGMTFAGEDFVSNAIYSEYDSGEVPYDYTILVDDAKEKVLNGEISQIITSKGVGDRVDESVWDIILYVPPKTQTPLYVVNDSQDDERQNWSQAFTLKSKNLIMSIVNAEDINHGSDKTDIQLRRSNYLSAVREALSYVGSSIRKQLGLSGTLPQVESKIMSYDESEIELEVKFYCAASKCSGIMIWEMDKLIRKSLSVKVSKVIRVIERAITLIHSRNQIAFRSEEAQLLEKCIKHVIYAKTALETNSNKYKVMAELNSAIDLAMTINHIDEIFELPYVSADMLFAIFGSLIFPLLAPMVKNVFPEIKRYKNLRYKVLTK